ncbi:hypothetical protein L198_07878 [Cryptococcus wingfieldii CBS 7118]|uniref:Peptidase A1 domain-containing protein n=1 Tax=Cryptococcus wingfieldii CBS 7118 TaxID=1295528 RepID=A0A1E3HUP6_9TREE|nr:hypothetical protein L198_07878 [Cryptococcus wingfieldii CBS 7118]ODN80068.1 hypothetical protein L198_07878 [Cryptococcus wingfieldii CBS 7118]
MLLLTALLPCLLLASAHPHHTRSHAPRSAHGEVSAHPSIDLTLLPTRQFSECLEDRQEWLHEQTDTLLHKYAALIDDSWKKNTSLVKKDVGVAQLTDVNYDASYLGTVHIGTPPQELLLVLDTGSADLWAAGTDCANCGDGERFNPSASSTYQASSGTFSITYGSGSASGDLGTDVVELANFTVPNTTLAVVDQASSGLISAPLSGIMGLAFSRLSNARATPWWETLVNAGRWDSPEFGVYLARYRNDPSASTVEGDGGAITFGGIDTTKFAGELNYVPINDSARDYWRIPLEGLTINNHTPLNPFLPQSSTSNRPQAGIDTGTTLIGAPPSTVQAIYAQIPGSSPLPPWIIDGQGLWQYPCSQNVSALFQFGGQQYSMSNTDMNLGPFTSDSSMCTGAFFEMQMSPNSPIQWIVGASFLKNVYTSFRNTPTAIGFAPLVLNAASNNTIA